MLLVLHRISFVCLPCSSARPARVCVWLSCSSSGAASSRTPSQRLAPIRAVSASAVPLYAALRDRCARSCAGRSSIQLRVGRHGAVVGQRKEVRRAGRPAAPPPPGCCVFFLQMRRSFLCAVCALQPSGCVRAQVNRSVWMSSSFGSAMFVLSALRAMAWRVVRCTCAGAVGWLGACAFGGVMDDNDLTRCVGGAHVVSDGQPTTRVC